MNNKYILVEWPEIQAFIDHPRWKKVYNKMKKVLFLYSILILCSCTPSNDGSNTIKDEEVPVETIREFKYKKHSYIMFIRGFGTGVAHDPDCSYCYDK